MMMVELVLNRLWLSFYVVGSVGHGAELLFDMVTMFAVCDVRDGRIFFPSSPFLWMTDRQTLQRGGEEVADRC